MTMRRSQSFGCLVAGVEPVLQDVGDLAGCSPGPGGQIGDELMAAAQEVRCACLMCRFGVGPVDAPAVTDHGAGVVGVDQLFGGFEAAIPIPPTWSMVISVLVATHNQALRPPTFQPVSSIVTVGDWFAWRTRSACTGTSAVPVDWAAVHNAPAVTLTPNRANSFEHFTNHNPSP
jgi:hypothetical protein